MYLNKFFLKFEKITKLQIFALDNEEVHLQDVIERSIEKVKVVL